LIEILYEVTIRKKDKRSLVH